jgi:hypothetical protein
MMAEYLVNIVGGEDVDENNFRKYNKNWAFLRKRLSNKQQ